MQQGDAGLPRNGLPERQHGLTDIVVLLALLAIAIVTWASFADAGVPPWRPFAGVAIAWLLALAALTRHRSWSASIRGVLGGWLAVAPDLLNFTAGSPARWAYLAIGALVAATSVALWPWHPPGTDVSRHDRAIALGADHHSLSADCSG
jgi:hypothetical protein